MYIVVFKFSDNETRAHACPTMEVYSQVLQDVMHHANPVAWRMHDGTGWADGSDGAWKHINTLPETARIELD